MKIVHINTSNKGGAGIAALRLHERLLAKGIESKFLSLYNFPSAYPEQYQFRKQDYASFPASVDVADFGFKVMKKLKLRQSLTQRLEEKYLSGRPDGFDLFSFPESDYRIQDHPLVKEADIVHLHWVSDSFLDYQGFFSRTNRKVVWTLHDMFPFTGGCHHSDGCMKFTSDCEACPQLKGTRDNSMAAKNLFLKKSGLQHISDSQMSVVTPSSWLMGLSKESALFRRFAHSAIPNVVNAKAFSLRDKLEARKKLNISLDRKVILFVAHNTSNVRKGGKLLLEALERLQGDANLLICSVGAESDTIKYPLEHLPFQYVNDEERMALLYTAADVFVLPSLAENFPNTICESLLCGTPAVAFSVGGIPELIDASSGKLAAPFDTQELAASIRYVLDHKQIYSAENISRNAHQKMDVELTTNRYIAVYNDLLKANA